MSGCFNCALIGDGSLLVQCAQQLIDNGHHVNVIISADLSAKKWAESNNIPTIAPQKEIYSSYLSSVNFDYLFSIVHLEIIPKDVLDMAKKLSINYHDALLPAYAGIHATSWSLINQERTHGVTWHEMLPVVDEGRILVQRLVDAELGDTAFSLNLKCYEAAIESFNELIHGLAKDELELVTQDLSKRTYFSKYQRPENLSMIPWQHSAESVQAFINGLDFGNYDNPLATAKFYCGERFFCVDEVAIAKEKSRGNAGIIYLTEQGELRVTTGTQDVILVRLKHLNGKQVDPQDVIQPNTFYNLLDHKTSQLQQDNYLQSARNEPYWVSIFNAFDTNNNFKKVTMRPACHHHEWSAPSSLLDSRISSNQDIIVLVCGFLSRARKAETYVIGVEAPHTDDHQYYLKQLPLVWSLTPDASFDIFKPQLMDQLNTLIKHKHCPIDIFARYTSLLSERMDENRYKFEISLVILNTEEDFLTYDPVVATHGITLLLEKSSGKWHLFAGEEAEHELIYNFEKKLNLFISQLTHDTHLCRAPLSRINLLRNDEIKLLEEVNQQNRSYPLKSTVEMFYEQSKATPQKVALVSDGHEYNYLQLQQRADQIAAQLLSQQITPGDRVGVLLERSFDMVAALLATMRTSAIYVPLDPIYPDDRLQHMIDDSGLKVLLTQSTIHNNLNRHNFHSLYIDQLKPEEISSLNSLAFPSTADSAYIIYTSGSTGKPKGVEVTHQGLTNFLVSMAEAPGFTAEDYLLSVTTVCFDIAGLELYLPLIKGGAVEICSAHDAKDGFALLDKLQERKINVLQATPTTWEMLLAAGWTEKLPLKALCGGEPLRKELANHLIPLCDELWNMYGPTETTIWSSVKRIIDATQITVGKPIANTTFYVLDDYLNPVSTGEKGELYIGGDGLARGYWQRDELTQEKFIPNPFSNDPASRLYRTGDAACFLHSGDLSCLGRIDNQIKLNGYRIELGEIETSIESLDGIEKAVVTIQTSEQSSTLHAFILYANTATKIPEAYIKQHLASLLPEYMIPNHFHTVTAFPLTLNGKVDRKILTASLASLGMSEDGLRTDRTDSTKESSVTRDEEINEEERGKIANFLRNDIVTIIKDLLNISSVDPTLPFGQYGFNSLRFTQLSAKIKDKFSIKLSPAIFYSHVSVDKICSYLVATKHLEPLSNFYQAQLDTPTNSQIDKPVLTSDKSGHSQHTLGKKQPLAIVGMALQMPEAKNAEDFWHNLIDGVDCITEIPSSRWDWRTTEFGTGDNNPYKLGGFIPNIRGFDAAFFNISPREAELMDPQQRLFLQTSYHALEDAGLSLETVSGANMGVFVGVVTSDYWDLVQKHAVEPDGYTISGNINCVIANRVSYQFNLRGPSAVIDTACSSSLVAMHRAIRAIHSGECDSAIVGGVNVIASPYIHHSFSKNGMLSKDGHCMSFDDRANGYVRSEGIAAMIIKPLDQAERDGDAIYGVILGSAENHGGRTNSLSAPSGEAQCELIVKAVKDAAIDVHSLSYIEAHGSGTPLGDPIEIEGIKRAFEQLGKHSQLDIQPCGIGSVKSNIGHLEAVAGQAGLAKVLLALKHQTLPGMPMFINQNKHIDISDSQFYFTAKAEPWVTGEINGHATPRRAGVSSFGFGGVNAHVIVEEYTTQNSALTIGNSTNVLLLSAKSKTQLRQLAEAYLRFFRTHGETLCWQSCCYTSQIGRSSLDERLLIEASTINDACQQLQTFIHDEATEGRHLVSNVKSAQEYYFSVFKDISAEDITHPLLQKRAFSSLGRLWLAGVAINWQKAYKVEKPITKSRLPLYPFNEIDYWLPNSPTAYTNRSPLTNTFHPLLDETPEPGVFVKHLDISNPLIGDHLVDNVVIFPAVGYLEFARAAGDQLAREQQQGKVVTLKGNVWFQALVVDQQQKTLEITLEGTWPTKEYVIRSRGQQQQIHARGMIEVSSNSIPLHARIDIAAIKARCNNEISHTVIYELFSQLKFNYKDGYKPIRSVAFNSRESLAEIHLPEKFNADYAQFILHPSLLEGGIQTVIGILANPDQDSNSAYLPFSMKSLTVYGALTKECFVHAELTSDAQSALRGIRKFDIRIMDIHGNCLVEIKEYCLKTLNVDRKAENRSGEDPKIHFNQIRKNWITSTPKASDKQQGRILVFTPTVDFTHHVTASENLTIVIPREKYQYLGDNFYTANPQDEHSIAALFAQLKKQNSLPDHIIFAWSYLIDNHEKGNPDAVIASVIKPFYAVCSQAVTLLRREKSRILFAYSAKDNLTPLYAGISGLIRSLHQETSKIKASVIALEADLNNEAQRLLDEVSYAPDSVEVRYRETQRMLPEYHVTPVDLSASPQSLATEDTLCLITGATGGIGRQLVKHLHRQYGIKLALIGRQSLSKALRTEWTDIDYQYYSCDITDAGDLKKCVEQIEMDLGKITGVIHCAGALADKLITKKSMEDIEPVIAPKVKGIYVLDEATRHCPLAFFYGFSSISATMGNMGQTDYGYANAVIEEFCEWRNSLVANGQRQGRAISLSWPLWLDGGMSAAESAVKYFRDSTGVEPITSIEGLALLDFSLANLSGPQVIVRGDASQLLNAVRKRSGLAAAAVKSQTSSLLTKNDSKVFAQTDQQTQVESTLLNLAITILKLEHGRINADSVLSELGFDSIANTELATAINNHFGTDITPIIFFEHSTLREVAKHLVTEYAETLQRYFGNKIQTISNDVKYITANNATSPEPVDNSQTGGQTLSLEKVRELLLHDLKELASSITKVSAHNISDKTHLNHYGFDSISNTEFISEINSKYKTDITPVVLFEYNTLSEFAEYLLSEFKVEILTALGNPLTTGPSDIVKAVVTQPAISLNAVQAVVPETTDTPLKQNNDVDDDIAIIGMQALMPESEDLDDFWLKLWEGQDFIREVPEDRWSWQDYFGKASEQNGKTQSRWGSFIKEIDKFDADFFGIDASEAALLDPQQRLFIQLVWHAIENAGYKVSDFSGTRTGLYVGLSNRDYADYLHNNGIELSPGMSFGNNHAFLVNRVSYLFDFSGPSEPIDTLCSSSLVAIHRAAQDLKAGICSQAIVGGISIMMSPRLSSVFEQANMLSAAGRCKSFDESADGFVRGEGGAAIVLKPLSQAKADKDNILAVIKGSYTNHGGHAASLTAPNLKAQYQLIKEAYSRSGVHPATVSYIEAHGTGTKLGDPIEISALKKAFNEFDVQDSNVLSPACAIGTVKTNIGHLESASGIASVIKVLLSLKFKKLPGLLHLNNVNPYLDLKKSAFYLLDTRQNWEALTDINGYALPRRAGVNAFGAGGVNAHVILEEYSPGSDLSLTNEDSGETTPVLILLSAKTEQNIRTYAKSLSHSITQHTASLADIAYTLQVGRDALDHRLAIIVDNKDSLANALNIFAETGQCTAITYNVIQHSDKHISDAEIDQALRNRDLDSLKDWWIKGEVIDWRQLYTHEKLNRIDLPGYPFSRTRHWVDVRKPTPVRKTDVFDAQKASATRYELPEWHQDFRQGEPYLTEHKVFDDEVLLGVTYASMALEAVRSRTELKHANCVRRIVFYSPLSLTNEEYARVFIRLNHSNPSNISFESQHQICDRTGIEKSSTGSICFVDRETSKVDLPSLAQDLTAAHTKNDIYELLRTQGVDYQGSLTTVEKILVGESQALSMINLSNELRENTVNYFLHPVWLDAAIVSAKFAFLHDPSTVYIPFSVDEVVIHQPPANRSYCVIKRILLNEQILKCDAVICNERGEVVIEASGIVCKRILSNSAWKRTRQHLERA
jgi:polyketide synthase PksJ